MSIVSDNTQPSVHDKISKVSKKADDTHAMLSNCYLALENLKLEHASLKEIVDRKSESDDVKLALQKLYSSFEPIQQKLLHLDDQKDMTNALLREVKTGYKSHTDVLTSQSSKLDETFRALEVVKSMITAARTDLDSNMNSAVFSTKQEIEKKIAALPIPTDSVNILQVKQHVSHALEPVALDAKNSFLSAQNNERRLEMLEKKIENLLLKFANIELRKEKKE